MQWGVCHVESTVVKETMKKTLFLFTWSLVLSCAALAQGFSDYFVDQTLRIDYQFAGNARQQSIYVDQLNLLPRWYGKRNRLGEVPVEGDGQITVRDRKTGRVIYRNSFCTLFHEWLASPEAQLQSKSFENVFLVPMPKDTVDVTVSLFDNRHEVKASLTHEIVPSDVLIRKAGWSHVTPYRTIQRASDSTRCIHIAFIAEGYTAQELPLFHADVDTAVQTLFSYEPFKSMRSRFNVVAVDAVSQDSGTSEPSQGIWKNTALHSHFDTFYSSRYLTTLNLKALHDYLAGIPYEHIIVLVNSSRYGGGGILNSYNLTSTHHQHYKPVLVHEFGHSFAGLGDEYAYESEEASLYPEGVEPWEPNLTTLTHFEDKWGDLIEEGTPVPTPDSLGNQGRVGVYEGAGYSLKGVYRPSFDCRMRTNKNPDFCPVCTRAIRRLIKFYTH